MSILITLGNLNPFTFANSIIAANLKAIELFGEPLSRVEVFHSMESLEVLQAAKRKEDGVTWVDHLESNAIEEKIFVHHTLEVTSTGESVKLFTDRLEPIVQNAQKRGKKLLMDLSNGTNLSRHLLSNAANALNIPHKYMIDVLTLFRETDKREFIEPGLLKKRYVAVHGSIPLEQPGYGEQKKTVDKIKILFLASNPIAKGGSPLRLGDEIKSITQKIRLAEYRDSLELIPVLAPTSDDLIQSFNQHKPHIVQFSGHGDPSNNIYLADEFGLAKAVNSKALLQLFETLKDNIRVVVLNACYTKAQAEAITGTIDCAIGMKKKIGNKAASVFAASFYRAVGFGRSVKEAFEQGKLALSLEGIHGKDKPELFAKNGVDPGSIYLIESPSS